MILNVNVPDLPYEQLAWLQVHATRPPASRGGRRAGVDPRGRPIYWVGPAGAGEDAGQGTDFHAVGQWRVSVTPLQVDLTRHTALDDIGEWLRDPRRGECGTEAASA